METKTGRELIITFLKVFNVRMHGAAALIGISEPALSAYNSHLTSVRYVKMPIHVRKTMILLLWLKKNESTFPFEEFTQVADIKQLSNRTLIRKTTTAKGSKTQEN